MSKQPNIILINADDLGYGDLACYGSKFHKTPHLDRLASEGMRMTDFYATAAICTPSRAGLMTGCYQSRVGMDTGGVLFPGDAEGLNPDEITIAEVLKKAGYKTKMVGKWHLGDQPSFLPTRHGFDSYYGLPYSNDMTPDLGVQRNVPPLPLMRNEEVEETQPDQSILTDRYLAESLHFIDECTNEGEPFFLYFAHLYVHAPIHARKRYLMNSQNGRYGAAVEHIDAGVGVLLEHLEKQGIDDNSLIIFTSDNGANGWSGGGTGPLRGFKGSTYEGGFRMPCIMRWPQVIPAGATCEAVTSMMDLLPTLASIAGVTPPEDRIIDGHDISTLLRGESSESPYEAFYYYQRDTLAAVRRGRWKLHVGSKKGPVKELYDLHTDIGEQHNVYEDNPDVVAELSRLAEACREDLGDALTGTKGKNRRPVGRAEEPTTLTSIDTLDPYLRALYDLDE